MIRRILNFCAVILLLVASQLPLWKIEIWAPQYPEGLTLNIGFDKIGGNVDQINILNHYIGMKKIVPDQIPELKLMPKILMGLAAFGVIVVLTDAFVLNVFWLVTLILAGTVGMCDFFLWGYDYGHTLNPNAPIRIPGMTYQPPLIGHKTLLNIDSYSLPDSGSYVLFLSLALAIVALAWVKMSQSQWMREKFGLIFLSAISLISLHLLGCTSKPEAIQSGHDVCHACHMTISDPRFGGELLTEKGKAYKFDSLSCLIGFYKQRLKSGDSGRVFVEDYFAPGAMIRAEDAHFLVAGEIHAPMGPGIVATANLAKMNELRTQSKSGEEANWQNVLSRF